jgi:hypothetical protein
MAKRMQPPARRATTRAKQSSRTRDVDAAEHVEPADDADEPDDEIATDTALFLFLRKPPSAADHCVIIATTQQGEHVVQDRTVSEVRKQPKQLANAVLASCSKLALSERRELRFRATWQQGDRVVASYAWRVGDGDPTALDGTVDSFLRQQQQHSETLHRVHLEGLPMLQDGWNKLLSSAHRRIDALEKQNEELSARLRKAGDVEAEVIMATTASDLEARTRTADMIQDRLLPLLQHLLLKAANSAAAVAPAPAAEVPKHDPSNDKPSG